MSQKWYVRRGNNEQGPYSPQELKQLSDSGILADSEFVRTTMDPEWRMAGTVKGLFSDTAQKQPVPPPISPISSNVPVSMVDEPRTEKKKSGLDDLFSTANQAKDLAAAYAAKFQITQFALPKAYRALGKEVFDNGRLTDDLNGIFQKITSGDEEIAQIAAQAEQRPKAIEWKGKLKSGAACVMDRGRVLELKTRRRRFLQELGNKAFQALGSAAGSEAIVSSITTLMDKMTSLDERISQLSNGTDGPLWQRIPVAVLLTVFVIPVGLPLVWLNPHLSRRQKGLWTVTSLSLFLVAAFAFTHTRSNHLAATGDPLQPTSTVDRPIKIITKIEPEMASNHKEMENSRFTNEAVIDPEKYVAAQLAAVLAQVQQQQKQPQPASSVFEAYRNRPCNTCGGGGWYRYVDGRGSLICNPCPTCSGSGKYLK